MTATPNVQIIAEPVSGTPLVLDYLSGRGSAREFYRGAPNSLRSFEEKLVEVTSRFGRPERERAARALHPTSERAAARLQTFVEQGGAMVTTGQQAGLFTGPFYTLHKALTAARLAAALDERLGVVVIPVFWVASEDHDWEEANHTFVGMPANGTVKLSLAGAPSAPHAMGRVALEEEVLTILDRFGETVGATPFADDVLRLLRGTYLPRETLAGAFYRIMGELLAPFDFCITEAGTAAVKEASVPVLERALTESSAHEALLRERDTQLSAAGYPSQVAALPGATNVFFHDDTGRTRLYRAEGGFQAGEGGRRFEEAELLALCRESPGSLSPNVLLRPLIESATFPTLAYVGGPGEVSYFAQINALFPAFGIMPPVIYPRAAFTLVEPAMQRLLDKLGFSVDDLARPIHELVDDLARRAMPPEITAIVEDLSVSVTDGYRRLIEVSAAVDPTLEDALASLRNQVLARIGDSEKKVVRQLKRKEEITVSQLERVRANLRPEGEPQDRVLNGLPFLARHGPGLLHEIAALIEPELT
ncbi:MAG: bacillithiol biosynthesis cysteine-adding enzyme BshC [Gemmatimonadetes bacterium]|nr:bacillithiol biosynthesis cysteine-adding enzyme BshC [Gemmatimonadota bacterium]